MTASIPASASSCAARLCSACDAALDASLPARTTARRIRSKSFITRWSDRPPLRSSESIVSVATSASKGRSRRIRSWKVCCFSLRALVMVEVKASTLEAAKLCACFFEFVIFGLGRTVKLAFFAIFMSRAVPPKSGNSAKLA